MRYISLLLILTFLSINSNAINVVPLPNHITEHGKGFVFNPKTKWIIENERQASVLTQLFESFRIAANYNYKTTLGNKQISNSVLFKNNSLIDAEGYKLMSSDKSIVIEASTQKGFYYAVQTLRQLLPVEINRQSLIASTQWKIPGLTIEDSPRFGYRGFMLDVSRYFMQKKDLLRIIDYLALHKINYLHLHLVDDNGWRLQIKKYPKLTDVGAWRTERNSLFHQRPNAIDGEPEQSGGFYTQKAMTEIVAYAQSRFVEIIPEIEMPAHTNSSLAAYPQLTCPVVEESIHVIPGGGGPNASIIYCAGNEEVFHFLKDVIDEVIQLFPSEYIHIGGDEAAKKHWEQCPLCQARIKKEGLANTEDLQSYFVTRMADYIKGKGKKVMGWDELTNAAIPEGTTIFGWRGMGEAALKAANLGHPIVMTPARALYLIRYQGPQWFEPFTYFGNNTLEDVYQYEPTSAMSSEQAEHLLGIQASLWTEFVTSPQSAEYLIFPRLAAMAEAAWTMPGKKNWANFVTRIDNVSEIYAAGGINYATSQNNLFHIVKPMDGHLQLTLTSMRPDVKIRYTLDGSEPNENSAMYNTPFLLKPGDRPRAASFIGQKQMGEVLTLNCRYNLATGAPIVSEYPNAYVLTNGLLGSEKSTDGEYMDMYNMDGEFVLDLKDKGALQTLDIMLLNNNGGAIHLPSQVEVLGANELDQFNRLAQQDYTEAQRFSAGLYKERLSFDLGHTTYRYIKVKLYGPGICPKGHVREGAPARMAVDELIVK